MQTKSKGKMLHKIMLVVSIVLIVMSVLFIEEVLQSGFPKFIHPFALALGCVVAGISYHRITTPVKD